MKDEFGLSRLEICHIPNWEQTVLETEIADSKEDFDFPEDIRKLLEKEDRVTIPSKDPTDP